jgi:hypothetical protein
MGKLDMPIGEGEIENETFFLDTLKTSSFLNMDLSFQCEESDLSENLKLILQNSASELDYKIKFTPSNKRLFLNEIRVNHISMYFDAVDARTNNVKLFEMYDGCGFALFSPSLSLPAWFTDKYSGKGKYIISEDWVIK